MGIYHINWLAGFLPSTARTIFCWLTSAELRSCCQRQPTAPNLHPVGNVQTPRCHEVQGDDFPAHHISHLSDFHERGQLTRGEVWLYGCFRKLGYLKSSILIGFSIINHSFLGATPIFGSTHMEQYANGWSFHEELPSGKLTWRLLEKLPVFNRK